MMAKKTMTAVAVLALVGFVAGVIGTLKTRQRVGNPGVKLVEKPIFNPQGKAVANVSVGLPEKILNHSSTNLPMMDEELKYLPKDTTYGRRRYLRDDRTFADMTVVLMGVDRTSIHKPQYCLTSQGWRIEKSDEIAIPMSRPHRYELPVMRLTTAPRPVKMEDGTVKPLRAMYVYWFVAEKRLTADHRQRMWGTVEDLVLTGILPRWAYISCLTFCSPGNEEAAFQWVKELITEGVPEFQTAATPPAAARSSASGPMPRVYTAVDSRY